MTQPPGRYSPDFRHRVVREVVIGSGSVPDVATRFGVAESTLSGWVEAYRRLYLDDPPGRDAPFRPDTAFPAAGLHVLDGEPEVRAAGADEPVPGELDVLTRWLHCLRDPLIPVEPRLAAQSAVLARYHDAPVRTGLVLAGVLTAIGEALREAAELIGWPPLEIDDRPAVNLLSARVGGMLFGRAEVPANLVVDLLMGPPRISRVFPDPMTDAAWAVVFASTADEVLVSAGDPVDTWAAPVVRIHGTVSTRIAAVHCALAGAYATGGPRGALSATAAALGATRWMLAANEVIGRDWAPTRSRLSAAAQAAVDLADELLQRN